MARGSEFGARKTYEKAMGKKANQNPLIFARVGNGAGVAATGRANFYYIRLINDDNRLTQCYSMVPLANNDWIYVKEAKDRKLRYYEFAAFIQDAAGGTAPPVANHDHSGAGDGGQLDWDDVWTDAVHDHSAAGEGGQLDWDSVWTDAVHDHSAAAEGGDDLNPETISPQTFLVGPAPCPYNTVGAAIVAVNAAGPPASGTEYAIEVMAGTYSETADITIPSYCTVRGRGIDITIIETDDQLFLSSNSSLQNCTVEHGFYGVQTVDSSSDWLVWNVLSRQTVDVGGGTGFRTGTSSSGIFIHAIVDAADVSGVNAFYIATGADCTLIDCQAGSCEDGAGGIIIGLRSLGTSRSYYCVFQGTTSDVAVDASGTWYQIDCQVDTLNLDGTMVNLGHTPINFGGWADALILSADGDTTISAPTDGQIDFETEAADTVRIIGAAGDNHNVWRLGGTVLDLDFTGTSYDTDAEMRAIGLSLSDAHSPFPGTLEPTNTVGGTWTHVAATGWRPDSAVNSEGPGILIPLCRGANWELEIVLNFQPANVAHKVQHFFGIMDASGVAIAWGNVRDNNAAASELQAFLRTNDGDNTATSQYTGVVLAGAGERTYAWRCQNACYSLYDEQDDAWHDYESSGGHAGGIGYSPDFAFIHFCRVDATICLTYLQSLKLTYLL